jgi:hypothetical protein
VTARRYFTRDQAERLLPQVEESVREIVGLKESLLELERELRGEAERISLSGGALVDAPKIAAARDRRQSYASRLQEAVEALHRHGCLLKDLDLGLLDFPTLLRGEEVYLCWKLGERRIEFWHGVEEGFRGRKPIDDDFLENHAGG